MKTLLLVLCAVPLMAGCGAGPNKGQGRRESPRTFCNPVNIDYRFMKIDGGDGIREAADPVVVEFEGNAITSSPRSRRGIGIRRTLSSGRVWIDDTVLPIEDYAPGLFVYDGYLLRRVDARQGHALPLVGAREGRVGSR